MYSPEVPEIRASFPSYEKPFLINIFDISSSFYPPKAVPYLSVPSRVPALAAISSNNLPTVILDGYPWGFMIKSGLHPVSEKGISS